MYLHNQLVGSGHECEAVGVVESLRDVLAEGVAGASGRDTPPTTIIRVRPQQVAHRTLHRRRKRKRVKVEDKGGTRWREERMGEIRRQVGGEIG